MEKITELLERTTLENTNALIGKGREGQLRVFFADSNLKPIGRLRKTFDHFLFFRTVCETTSGHTPESEQIVAGLSIVDEVSLYHLTEWSLNHAREVSSSTIVPSTYY